MSAKSLVRWSLALALSGALLAAPESAEAQGKSREKERERPELIRRGEARGERDDRLDRYDSRSGVREDRGPAFCRSGEGHPVHGRRWCVEKGFGLGGGRSDAWYGDTSRNRSSYDRAHEDFHLRHDRECRMRAAERPLDLQWQLRVRQECREAHDEWHARAGRRHG